MPISLITGVPGSGKTAWMVHQLMTRADLKDRPLYVFNIPDLKVPHEAITEEQAITWPEWAPTGALFVMDECQRVFRPRRSGSDVPAYVSEFETHRHRGLDFFLLTQNPRLIDANVRDLVGEHRHIGKTLIGLRRMLYWNSGGAKTPAARRDIAEASTSVFFLPKKAFGMYKSAEEHTVVSGKLAKGVYVLPIALAATVYGVYVLKGRYDAHTAPNVQAAQAAKPQASGERAALAISEPDAGGYYPSASAPAPAAESPQKAKQQGSDSEEKTSEKPQSARGELQAEAEELLRDMFGQHSFEDSMVKYRRSVERIRKALLLVLPAVLGVLVATTFITQWDTVALFFNYQEFGVKDPEFGLDIGFFVFTFAVKI